jgi:hypothetical protein
MDLFQVILCCLVLFGTRFIAVLASPPAALYFLARNYQLVLQEDNTDIFGDLIIYEIDQSFADEAFYVQGIRNEDGSAVNGVRFFTEKSDAEKYVEWVKEWEEDQTAEFPKLDGSTRKFMTNDRDVEPTKRYWNLEYRYVVYASDAAL